MKYIVYLLAALFIAVGAAFYLQQLLFTTDNPGHVLIGIGNWSIETSLYFAVLVLMVSFVFLYVLIRLISHTVKLPGRIKQKGSSNRGDKSYQSLVSGLVDSAEGNWEKAEKSLIHHAANSGTPLMHYLTAAKAAQARGAFSQRDEYLQLAHESTPGSELTVGLTEAELQLSENEFGKALESLKVLQSIAPTHATVLKLLYDTYRHLDDWQAIRKILPDLSKNKVLMDVEIKLLETETYSELLKGAATSKNQQSLKALWAKVPSHIKAVSGMNAVYYAAMIDAGAGIEIETALRKDLEKNWNETLVVLYGCIQSDNPKRQLAKAESWVSQHPGDAILLRMIGKLCIRVNNQAKAETYLQSSVDIEPSVDAFLFLGDVLSETDQKDRALKCYRNGLLFASEEVVRQIDNLPIDPEESPSAQTG